MSLPVLAGSLAALGIVALVLGAAPAGDEPEPGSFLSVMVGGLV